MLYSWIQNRNLGLKNNIGDIDRINKTIYASIQQSVSWGDTDIQSDDGNLSHGGVFNLEFSHDGYVLNR